MKGHEYNVKQHDYYVTWHDYTPRGGPLPSGCNEDNTSGALREVYINIV